MRHPRPSTRTPSRRVGVAVRGALGAALTGAAAVVLTVAGVASAHVGVDREEVTAGAPTVLTFSVGHGCGGSPTRSLRFRIPDGVVNAQPVVHPGWEVEVEREQLDEPASVGHGQEVTDRAAIITFTAQEGNELPDELRDRFSIAFTAPDAESLLWFKVVQGCVEGETPWIDEWDGTGEEPEHLAPSVRVVASPGAPGAPDAPGAPGAPGAAGDAERSANSAGDGDGDGADPLSIVAVVVGAAGLVVGGIALARSGRRAPSTP